jgi:hypothetical protein
MMKWDIGSARQFNGYEYDVFPDSGGKSDRLLEKPPSPEPYSAHPDGSKFNAKPGSTFAVK